MVLIGCCWWSLCVINIGSHQCFLAIWSYQAGSPLAESPTRIATGGVLPISAVGWVVVAVAGVVAQLRALRSGSPLAESYPFLLLVSVVVVVAVVVVVVVGVVAHLRALP